jgi:hypothetical protein
MPKAMLFKSGRDLGTETNIDEDDTVTCLGCSTVQTDQAAYEGGWQLVPPVCPDCLSWKAVEAADA